MSRHRFPLILCVYTLFAGCLTTFAADTKPTPPGQPKSGPGSSAYVSAEVTKNAYGEGAKQYWLYEPAKPSPKSAPVVVFNHGWSATNPAVYGAWIKHIVRRGNIVIYPIYQDSLLTPPTDFTPNAIAAVKAALVELKSGKHVRPQTDKFAVVGHSAGGLISANMAALAAKSGIPTPRAVMCVEPGKTWGNVNFVLEDLKPIPASTLLISLAGQDDKLVEDIDAKKIFNGATQVLSRNKNLVIMSTDTRGEPVLSADHLAPCAFDKDYDSKPTGSLSERLSGAATAAQWGAVNALDYYGFWKLFDGLCDAAFHGKNRNYALGNTPEQRYTGKWSDGIPVKELEVIEGTNPSQK